MKRKATKQQSDWRPCRQTNGRSKRTYELIHHATIGKICLAEPQLEKLVRRRTGELALLIEALAVSSQAAMNALSQVEKMEKPTLAGTDSS